MSQSLTTACPMQICVFSLSANNDSVGRKCVPFLQEQLGRTYVKTLHFDMREFEPVWVDGRDLADYPARYREAFDAVAASSGVVFITPVHCYTASGAGKQLTEILGDALARKPVAVLSSAGSMRSHLAMADLMKSMMFEQETICFPKSVQWTGDDIVDGAPNAELTQRLATFAGDFLDFCSALRPFSEKQAATHAAPEMFIELYIKDVAFHTTLFVDILGFDNSKQLGNWLDLRKPGQRLMLNWEDLPQTHPFAQYRSENRLGAGVETAFVVDDVVAVHRQCQQLQGGQVSDVVTQEWGMTDFRITTPEGYYIRITTAPPL
jgi:lactoylglutathione lyase